SLAAGPYGVLMPVFAKEILHGDASSLGLLLSSTGLGALAGALFLAQRQGFRGLGRWIATSGTGLGIALIFFAYSRVFWLSNAILFPVGMLMMIQMAGSNTLVQAMVPDALRGRVMSVYSMVFIGMAPLGALLAGALANAWGAPAAVASGGALTCVATLIFWRQLPTMRTEARQLIIAQQPEEAPTIATR
ncbi:MAG: MFS transporter, partial [Anaerolineae bacterium]|nr:MFS transporter [Anaerolineae bacterium]